MRWIMTIAVVAAMSATAWAQGPEGPSLAFDGVDDWVDMGAGPEAGAPFTIEAWVKPTLASTDPQLIVGPFGASGSCFAGAGFRLNGGSESTPGSFAFAVGLAGCGNDDQINGPVPTLGQWYHLAGIYDGSTMRFYVDGELMGELTNIDYTAYSRMVAGAAYSTGVGGPTLFFGGSIDDVRQWDHVRSQSEIDAGMSQELQGDETGLTGYWNFNEGSGQIAGESVAGEYNGRLGDTDEADDADPTWTGVVVETEAPPTLEEDIEALLKGVHELNLGRRHTACLSVRLRIALHMLRDDRPANDRAVVPLLRSFARAVCLRARWRLLDGSAQDLAASALAIIDRLRAEDDGASSSRRHHKRSCRSR